MDFNEGDLFNEAAISQFDTAKIESRIDVFAGWQINAPGIWPEMDGATGKNLLENRAPAFGVVGLNEEAAQFQRSGHGNLLLGNDGEA